MKNEMDPERWGQSSTEAPELLRGAFAAAAREGPSPVQMRMLALKLAAVAAGTAVAASAGTAQASATLGGGTAPAMTTLGGSIAAAGTLSIAKIAVAVGVAGAVALGGGALYSPPQRAPRSTPVDASARPAVPTDLSPEQAAGPVQALQAPSRTHKVIPEHAVAPEPGRTPKGMAPNDFASGVEADRKAERVPAAPRPARAAKRAPRRPAVRAAVTRGPAQTVPVAQEAHALRGKEGAPSEVVLLRGARSALAARPREAFLLTERHRERYPRGVFSQERDALAIEALLRVGDTDAARKLAETFVSAYPNSPHAHRFRETLGLR